MLRYYLIRFIQFFSCFYIHYALYGKLNLDLLPTFWTSTVREFIPTPVLYVFNLMLLESKVI